MKILYSIPLVFALWSSSTLANPILRNLFSQNYSSPQVYEEGRCRQNIQRLVDLAVKAGVNPEKLITIEILPLGDLWVNKARNFGNKITPYGRRAWMYHVVLFDGVTIYDFDYLDRPTPLPVKKYFDEMMMTDYYRQNRSECNRQIGWTKLATKNARQSSSEEKETRLMDTGWICN